MNNRVIKLHLPFTLNDRNNPTPRHMCVWAGWGLLVAFLDLVAGKVNVHGEDIYRSSWSERQTNNNPRKFLLGKNKKNPYFKSGIGANSIRWQTKIDSSFGGSLGMDLIRNFYEFFGAAHNSNNTNNNNNTARWGNGNKLKPTRNWSTQK